MTEPETITLRDTAGLQRVRQQVTTRALPILGEIRSGDAALVVSELSSNALQHGRSEIVRVRLAREDEAFVAAVAAEADALPVVPHQDVAHHQPAGRGLRIVAALVDSVCIATRGRNVEVLCRFAPADVV